MLAFLLLSLCREDVGGLLKEKPFKFKLDLDIIWGLEPVRCCQGEHFFLLCSVCYRVITAN